MINTVKNKGKARYKINNTAILGKAANIKVIIVGAPS